ncbi:heavy-metal-associated domain-containing protein [Flavobacterium sp. JP2137]|uniref:heavy-metal-associated domain-containing protein n=1 Tax=Flavobacterium sp. JP2137 TaxID=3414510 RepID=UPI003D2FC7C2
MKTIKNLLTAVVVLLSVCVSNAQIKNKTTKTVKINGNCSMCKQTMETAANVADIAQLNWNENTQTATLVYDKEKTTSDDILKRVAKVGYDNERFIAADGVYNKLHGCCQYDRKIKSETQVK